MACRFGSVTIAQVQCMASLNNLSIHHLWAHTSPYIHADTKTAISLKQDKEQSHLRLCVLVLRNWAQKNIAACASYGPRSCANTCPSLFGLQPPTYLSLVSFERRHFLKRCESFSFHTPVCFCVCLHSPANQLNPSFLLAALSVLFPQSPVHYTHILFLIIKKGFILFMLAGMYVQQGAHKWQLLSFQHQCS